MAEITEKTTEEITEWNERRPIHLICTAALCAIIVGTSIAAAAWFGTFDSSRQLAAFAFFCAADGVVAFLFALGTREYEAKDGKSFVVRNRSGLLLCWSASCVICRPIPFPSGLRVELVWLQRT